MRIRIGLCLKHLFKSMSHPRADPKVQGPLYFRLQGNEKLIISFYIISLQGHGTYPFPGRPSTRLLPL